MTSRRRRLLVYLVAVAVAVAFASATGAFSSVSAERAAAVSVAGDDAALLGLAPHTGPNGQGAYARLSNGELEILIDGTNTSGSGVNLDALTRIADVFNVTNSGTQDVGVWITKSGSHSGLVTFETAAGDRLDDNASVARTVAPGETIEVTIVIDTRGASLSGGETLLDGITIHADASEA